MSWPPYSTIAIFCVSAFQMLFHLWCNGGPNWKGEFIIWKKECDAEWILVSPSKRCASLGMIAMHKPPTKSSLHSGSVSTKKISFATFQQYDVCKGYRYPSTQHYVDTLVDAGYSFNARERVILPSPPATEF